MLLQLHYQNIENGVFTFIAQKDIKSFDEQNEFIDKTQINHPIPDGYQWMVCSKKSKDFVGTIMK